MQSTHAFNWRGVRSAQVQRVECICRHGTGYDNTRCRECAAWPQEKAGRVRSLCISDTVRRAGVTVGVLHSGRCWPALLNSLVGQSFACAFLLGLSASCQLTSQLPFALDFIACNIAGDSFARALLLLRSTNAKNVCLDCHGQNCSHSPAKPPVQVFLRIELVTVTSCALPG